MLTPFPHVLYALDPSAAPERRVRWQYEPAADRMAEGLSCCGRIDHGPIVDAGRVYFTTLDGHVVAVDAASGQPVWNVALTGPDRGEALTGPPVVAGGRVFVGSGGSDHGTRGWLAALDAASGRTLWQRFSTGPDADVGIGPGFAPPYDGERGGELGVATWPPGGWEAGGGAVAGPVLVDAEAGLVWHSTGPPSPWSGEQRPGDNKWTSGLFARAADSGAARWFDSVNPHNPLAWRDGGADLQVERPWNGAARKLLVHADGNGWLYVVDRASGELLAADAFTTSVVASVDLASGRPSYRADKLPRLGRPTRDACPAWSGAAGGPAALTGEGLVVLPVSRLCMDLEVRTANRIAGTPYVGANARLLVTPMAGAVLAWDLAARKPRWSIGERFPVVGGVTATAGGVVFYGTLDGWLKAVDGRDGRVLWQVRAPGGIVGRPAVWQSADGHGHVAVMSGARRFNGMTARDGIDPRDLSAGMGYGPLQRRLPEEADPTGTLLVFPAAMKTGLVLLLAALLLGGCQREVRELRVDPPVQAAMNEVRVMPGGIGGAPPDVHAPLGRPYEGNAWQLSQGKRLYDAFNCNGCHADGGGASGPALLDGPWAYGPDIVSIVVSIRDGRPNGMPPFRERLTTEQIWQLAGYVKTIGAFTSQPAFNGRNDELQSRPSENRAPAADPPLRQPSRRQ